MNYSVGEMVLFGKYKQGKNGEVEPIEWVVIKKENSKVLLLTVHTLDSVPYIDLRDDKLLGDFEKYSTLPWSETNLREFLNNEFMNSAFTEEEKGKIVETRLVMGNMRGLPAKVCYDKVFCLSLNKVRAMVEKKEYEIASPTEYLSNSGKDLANNGTDYWAFYDGNYHGPYVVSPPGGCIVDCINWNRKCAIRPAIWVETGTEKKMVTEKGTEEAPIPFTKETVGNFFSPIAEEENKLSGTVEVGTPVATPMFKDEEEEKEEKERKLASAPKTPDGEPLLNMSDCYDEKGLVIPEVLKKFKEQTPFRKAYMKEMKKKAITCDEEKKEGTEKEKAESFKEELSDECLFEDNESTDKQNDAFVDIDSANYKDGLKRNLRSFIKEYKKYVGIPEDCVCTHVDLGLVERVCNRYGYSLQDVLTYGIKR